jgi:hypothetical protein
MTEIPQAPGIPEIPQLSEEKQEIQALKDQIQLNERLYTLQYTKFEETIETLNFLSNQGQFNRLIYSKIAEILDKLEKIEANLSKNGK